MRREETSSVSSPPPRAGPNLDKYPLLSKEQLGHIRHIHNLASLPQGEWSHMFTAEPFTGQEFVDALRYQLATMTYAAGVAHYHHLPALRSAFKQLMYKLITKMLSKDVWSYWFNTSMSGVRIDPDLKELRKPWADPVREENIMYSGHLLLMVSLYAMLFGDDEFERDGSILFRWDPVFWGMGPEVFKYTTTKLQKVILDEMERNDWVGVCCEPNMVFVVCNQFPLIATRYNDVRNGTNDVEKVLERYQAAWNARGGMTSAEGFVRDSWMVKQKTNRDAKEWAFSAWNNAFMHAWNAEYIESNFPKQALGNIVQVSDDKQSNRYVLNPVEVATEFRSLVSESSKDPKSSATQAEAVARAKEVVKAQEGKPSFPYKKPILGYALQCLSELPGSFAQDALASLLDYTDKLNPTWENGGLYYPRNDTAFDQDMNWTLVSPYDGNAAIAYARLNVVNGQKIMWEKPRTREALQQEPYFHCLTLDDGIDYLRGFWDEEEGILAVSMQTWQKGVTRCARFQAMNLTTGLWELWIGGKLINTIEIHRGSLNLEQTVDNTLLDVVFRRV